MVAEQQGGWPDERHGESSSWIEAVVCVIGFFTV